MNTDLKNKALHPCICDILGRMNRWFAAAGFSLALGSMLAVISLPAAAPSQYPGTKRMADPDTAIFNAQDWQTDPYHNRQRIASLRQFLEANADSPDSWNARLPDRERTARNGRTRSRLRGSWKRRAGWRRSKGVDSNAALTREVGNLLSIAYLRQGEQENCLMNHGADSCIFPIERFRDSYGDGRRARGGAGIHGDARPESN